MNKVEELIGYGRENGCSDIHLTFGLEPMMRRGGKLGALKGYGMMNDETLSECADLFLKKAGNRPGIMDNIEDMDLCYETESGSRNRVSIYKQQGHTAIAIRLLSDHIPTLKELNVPKELEELTRLREGLVLVSGPAGSGKSTVLAACIHEINTNAYKHIITVEDPVEYHHKNINCMVNQREVGRDVDSFARAIKSAQREDADVILVGELREPETVLAAITAAETGRLVFSTLHISEARNAVSYMVDLFPAYQQQQIRTRLKSVLQAVVSQRLVVEEDHSERTAVREVLKLDDLAL